MFACNNGHKDVVQLLLDHSDRIDLNATDDRGFTAFLLACGCGHKDVVKLLLDHSDRIELNARNKACSSAQIRFSEYIFPDTKIDAIDAKYMKNVFASFCVDSRR